MTPVDVLYSEYLSIVDYLNENSQPSLSSDVNKHFKKIIILAAASYFEYRIKKILTTFVVQKTQNNFLAINFFSKKAIGMQYHTFFTWGTKGKLDKPGKNANTFFSLFGDEFKKQAEKKITQSKELDESMKAFLEIGHLRNILVHSNFAAYNFDNKTTEEAVNLYRASLPFIDFVEELLLD